ncbi:MAG: hypothetical protein M5R36_23310 [Deltaproteobacteria bacterium]|nr:hypothetical protein [Deltaproteobacteria bacterium]
MTFDVGSDVLKAFAVRAGGYRENSPVPDQNGQSNYIDPNKWVASAGFDLDMRDPFDVFMGPVHLGAAWQTHFMDRVTLHNRQDPDYPEIEAWGEIHGFTATLSICTQ